MAELRTVSILGSTGSIGRSTVDLLQSQPGNYSVQALTCNTNVRLLAEQAIKLKARRAVVADASLYNSLKELLSGTNIEVAAGPDAVIDAASIPASWIMAAIVGIAGLEPVLAAIAQGSCVAIANKEPLVAAGPFVMAAAQKAGTTLLPVDSEHNAIFQVFDHIRPEGIRRIVLTASGGPFRQWSADRIAAATPEQAVTHPNWAMGAKISVDSATMMNKALEVIEAHYLFKMPPEKISVVIHPQSTVHSLVEYEDGSILSQMGASDMRTPIAHALAWPTRMATTGKRLDILQPRSLDFMPLDERQFPAVPLAYACLKSGLAACVALNAANEEAVAAFLNGRIKFPGIVEAVQTVVQATPKTVLNSVADIISFDRTVRDRTKSYMIEKNG